MRDAACVKAAVSGIEIIFHEAAFVSVPQSMDEPQECFDVNITGTSLLFDAARRAGVRRAVVASSAAVYGDSEALPSVEETPFSLSRLMRFPNVSMKCMLSCSRNRLTLKW